VKRDVLGYERITVAPLAGSMGAEIGGVDLAKPLDLQTWDEILRAFHENIVIVFRDQQLDPLKLAAFGERFGPLTRVPYAQAGAEHPYVTHLLREADVPSNVKNVGDNWHADQSPRYRPSLGFALYCLEAPDYGGDTLFSNLYLAYEALSDELKALCERLTVMHSSSGKFGTDGQGNNGGFKSFSLGAGAEVDKAKAEEMQKSFAQETEHPLVCVHPATGRKILWVTGAYSVRFRGMTREESKPLLDQLNALAVRPDFTCRVRWKKGTLTVMDNRCSQHYALNDYAGFRRHMLRVEMDADPPVGPAMPKREPGQRLV
jgi:taurine dioxygenase